MLKAIKKYRFDASDAVYIWSEKENAYVFIGNRNNRTEKQFIKDYESREY